MHAVAPFWESASWRADLLRAYAAAFAIAAGRDVATPLLGAGARGAPVAEASAAAAKAVAAAASAPRFPRSVSFGVVEDEAFDALFRNCACLYSREHERFLHRKGKGTSTCAFRGAPRGSGEGEGSFEASGCPRQRAKFGGGDRCA